MGMIEDLERRMAEAAEAGDFETAALLRDAAVVVANDPMPSVSKKFTTKPISDWSARGREVACPCLRADARHAITSITPHAISSPSSA